MAAVFTDANFDAEVLKSETPVLVDFWAPWCTPCLQMGPVIDAMAEEYAGKIKVGKLDVDESPETAEKYGIMSIPTMKIFKNGAIVAEMIGTMSADKLRDQLNQHA